MKNKIQSGIKGLNYQVVPKKRISMKSNNMILKNDFKSIE
jgi:hypothetical protein